MTPAFHSKWKWEFHAHWMWMLALVFLFVPGCGQEIVDEISLENLSKLPSEKPIVVVNFWATWCPPCLTEIPHLNRLHQQREDVRVYGISIDDAALGGEVFKVAQKNKILYPVYMRERIDSNDKTEEWYGTVDAIPVTYVFKEGKLHNTILGAVENDEELAQAIDGPSQEDESFAEAEEEDSWEEDDSYSEEE